MRYGRYSTEMYCISLQYDIFLRITIKQFELISYSFFKVSPISIIECLSGSVSSSSFQIHSHNSRPMLPLGHNATSLLFSLIPV